MNGTILRTDLEPWTCDSCQAPVYRGYSENHRFYCLGCMDTIKNGKVEDENVEVNFEGDES